MDLFSFFFSFPFSLAQLNEFHAAACATGSSLLLLLLGIPTMPYSGLGSVAAAKGPGRYWMMNTRASSSSSSFVRRVRGPVGWLVGWERWERWISIYLTTFFSSLLFQTGTASCIPAYLG
ncbi:hypothetical protein F4809DRAFT_91123 [Biscogniauxia mediterranea]|nr:hypothetical protein F4809DRAFT_91123 [Biscogniauxia mediterranea]